jgi:hypothetical protein
MLWPDFSAKFGLVDDHEIVDALKARDRLPVTRIPGQAWHGATEPLGRFRPLFWVGQAVEDAIAGTHPTWWYLDRFLLAAVVLVAMFVVAAQLTGPLPAATVALLPFSGPQVETWTRLLPQETYAMALTAAGLALIGVRVARGRTHPADVALGLALLLLAAFVKENFVALAPAAALVTALATGIRRLTRWDWCVLGSVAFVAAADVAAAAWKVHEHGSFYPQNRTREAVQDEFWVVVDPMVSDGGLWFAVGVLGLVVVLGRWHVRLGALLGLLAVTLLVVTPQVVFLAGTVREGRYLYPAALAAAMLWILALWGVSRLPVHVRVRLTVTAACVLLMVIPLSKGVPYGHDVADANSIRTRAFQTQLTHIARAAERAGVTTVVLQPAIAESDYEYVASMATYLTMLHGLSVMTMPAAGAYSLFGGELNENLAKWSRHGDRNLVPYHAEPCLAVTFDVMAPVCTASVTFERT